MVKIILGFLGYSKIPVEAVQLSIINEDAWAVMVKNYPNSTEINQLYKGAKTLTRFLKSGKLLN